MVRVCLGGVAIAVFASSALAATPKKAKKPKPPSAVEILNQRAVKLESFTIAAADKPDKPLATLAKPLDGGAKIKLKIAGARGCAFIAAWKFEDAGDRAEVDLCNDPKVVLTD